MISHEHKFIFIHINKTGGTSIEKIFVDSADQEDVNYKHQGVSFYKNKFPLEFAQYFKFAFVRNPWDWLVSRYFWSKDHQELITISFEEFVLRLARKIPINSEVEWLDKALSPQSERLILNRRKLSVDFVGKFETLQEDFDKICTHIGIDRVTLPHVNKTNHAHYSSYYDRRTRRLVAKIYRKDIALFKYKFEKA